MARRPQKIRFVTADDGLRLAWADAGSGPPLVKAANWLSHLEYDWESPVWRHWTRFFAETFRYIRYDERGCGMSDADTGELSLDRWIGNLERVVDVSGVSDACHTPRNLTGRTHLRRLRRTAPRTRGPADSVRRLRAGRHAARRRGGGQRARGNHEAHARQLGQGPPGIPAGIHVAFRDRRERGADALVGRALSPDDDGADDGVASGGPERHRHSIAPAAGPRADRGHPRTRRRRGSRVGRTAPRRGNSRCAGYVELDSVNHILLEDEPAWQRFQDAVLDFADIGGTREPADSPFAQLSTRERQILTLMGQGRSNMEIAQSLGISDKTVRNQASKLFDKLGVWTRAQAIVFATAG